jgi:hypothetical protein
MSEMEEFDDSLDDEIVDDESMGDDSTDDDDGGSDEELSVERRAEMVGWTADGPKSAQEFLDERDGHMGLQRANIATLESKLDEALKVNKQITGYLKKTRDDAERRGYERALAEEAEKQRQAVEDSDGEAFANSKRREARLLEQRDKPKEDDPLADPPEDPPDIKLLRKAVEENQSRFDSRKQAFDWRDEIQFQVQDKGLSMKEAIAKANLIHLDGGKQRVPGGVRGESSGGGKRGGKTFAALPRDAKRAFQDFKEADPDLTEDEYARVYWEQS